MRRLTHTVGGSLLDGEKKVGSPLMANRKSADEPGPASRTAWQRRPGRALVSLTRTRPERPQRGGPPPGASAGSRSDRARAAAAGTSPAARVDAAAGSRDSTRSTDPDFRAEARGVGSAIGRKTI